MSEEKRNELAQEDGGDRSKPAASRARNQTVMLSPELTSQVRNIISRPDGGGPDPLSEILPSPGWDRPSGGSSGSNPRPPVSAGQHQNSGEYGSDLPIESDATPKRPTGKMKPNTETTHMSMHGGQPGPAFSVNPSAARPSAMPAQSRGGFVERTAPKSKIVGFLISFDGTPHGEVFEVRVGRWLLTSRAANEHGDNIIIDDDSISPLHAIVRATAEGKLQVLDQLSEFGTGVTRVGSTEEEEVAGAMVALFHGDRVRFGKRNFVVCVVPVTESSTGKEE